MYFGAEAYVLIRRGLVRLRHAHSPFEGVYPTIKPYSTPREKEPDFLFLRQEAKPGVVYPGFRFLFDP
jgi:hypothetical protein